jgi:hypothetical protein
MGRMATRCRLPWDVAIMICLYATHAVKHELPMII